jgi:hypothetical protein
MRTQMKVTLDISPMVKLQRNLDTLNKLVQGAATTALEEVMPDVMERLSVDPGPVKYPIEWQSERQRRAFFATDGFGAGIPYQRTGRVQQGWYYTQEMDGPDVLIELGNVEDKAPFVYGEMTLDFERAAQVQQRMHRNTGWLLAAPIAAEGLAEVSETVAEIVGEALFGKGRSK